MAHASLKLIPGVDQNRTPALNEAGISTTQLVRFVPDRQGAALVQKLGGWTRYISANIGSKVRALWGWADIESNKYLAVGAEQSLNVIKNGTLLPITPSSFSDSSPVKFETTAGSNLVTITDYGTPLTVTGASGTGTTATLTFSGSDIIPIGADIIVSGINPSGYNGTYVVTASSAGSVSYANATVAAYVSGGSIYRGNNTPDKTAVFISTPVSVGGLIVKGLYEAYSIDQFKFFIYATDTLGNPQNALWTTTSQAVTNASGSGTTVTLTYTGPYTFEIYSGINVTGIDPSAYNGSQIVTGPSVPTGTTVEYSGTTVTAYVSGGTIDNYGVVPILTTVIGSSSVIVTLPYHDYTVGEAFPIFSPITVGGITIPANSYTVSSVINSGGASYSFTINIPSQAASSDSVAMNGGEAAFTYYVGAGSQPTGGAYGIGNYGDGAYGTGATTGTTNPGTTITATDWTLDNLGSLLVACPSGGPIYIWDPISNPVVPQVIGSGPPANLGAFVAMPQRQIVAWGSSFDGIVDPLLIRWSDVANYTQYIGTVVNQAGSYRIPKGSKIVGALQGPQQGLIWTDLAVWAMQYVGPPLIYGFNEIGTGCGLIGPKAATTMGNQVFWMSQSQFYMIGEGGPQPIPCPVWDVIFQDLDLNNVNKIRAAANSRFGEVTWYYPTQSNGGEISHYVKYNVYLQTWDFGQLGRTAWINQSVLGAPIGAGSDNFIYQHETSQNADGSPMLSSFQTGYFALDEADLKVFVDQVWPDMKWGYYGGSQNATVYMTFYATDYAGQTPNQYGPFTLTQNTQFVTPRMRGRLVSIKIESTDLDSFWRLGNIRYRTQPDGKY